jgi:CRISPR-associated protein Csy2
MIYIILPHLKVQRANALVTPWLIGACPVYAAVMLGHALGRDTGVLPMGVGLVHHDATLLAESQLPRGYGDIFPQQYRAASFIDKGDYSSKNENALALQPTASAHLEVSLVLAYDGEAPGTERLMQALEGRRLAGGLIASSEPPILCERLRGDASVQTCLRSGFWVLDRSEQLDRTDRLGSLLDLAFPSHPPSPGEPRPWFAPAVLGYATLTPLAERQGVRDNLPHAFAEPLVGLVEYRSVRQIEPGVPLFWAGHWPDPSAYVLTQS